MNHIIDEYVHYYNYLDYLFYRWNNDPQCNGVPFPKPFDNYDRTLRDQRKKKYGKAPTTFEEIAVEFCREDVINDVGTSLYGKKRPLYNGTVITKDFCNCFFSSAHSIQLVKKNVPAKDRFFVMDATFDSAAKAFQQQLIIYIQFGIKV